MEKKIRVLHIGYSTNPGGIENVVFSWVKNLPNDIQFDFTNCEDMDLCYQEELENAGCKVFKIAHKFKNPVQHYKDLKNIIENGNYDYIHHHVMVLVEPDPYLLAKKNTRVISHCHSNNLEIAFGEKVLNIAAKFFIIGRKYLRLSCSEEGGKTMFKNKPFTIIENGIDIDRFRYSFEKRNIIRNKYGIADNNIVIGHVGRETIDKNYPFIISTFSKLVKINKNYKLMLVGDINCLSNTIIDMIHEYGIENNTICTGPVNNTEDYYSAMDVFFFPSLKEGLGMSLIEAQASGLPCVAGKNIPKDAKVSDNFVFIDYDENIAMNNIMKYSVLTIDRKKAFIDQRYNIKNSSAKLFEFYRNNLKKTI